MSDPILPPDDLRARAQLYMRDHSVSAARLAGRIGISRQAMSRWLTGSADITLRYRNMVALERILNGKDSESNEGAIGAQRPSQWPVFPSSDELLTLVALAYRAKRADLVENLTRVAESVYRLGPEIREINDLMEDARRELTK